MEISYILGVYNSTTITLYFCFTLFYYFSAILPIYLYIFALELAVQLFEYFYGVLTLLAPIAKFDLEKLIFSSSTITQEHLDITQFGLGNNQIKLQQQKKLRDTVDVGIAGALVRAESVLLPCCWHNGGLLPSRLSHTTIQQWHDLSVLQSTPSGLLNFFAFFFLL